MSIKTKAPKKRLEFEPLKDNRFVIVLKLTGKKDPVGSILQVEPGIYWAALKRKDGRESILYRGPDNKRAAFVLVGEAMYEYTEKV